MRRLILLLTAVAVLAVPGALAKPTFPATIALPNAFQPEGIAVGTGSTFYVGSIPTGAIYAGDLRTGRGETIIAGIPGPTGRRATGLEYHRGLLWVSGAGNGKVYVYDVGSRSLVREYALATAPTFINDVVVTNKAAYFTDSQKALLYKIELSANGRPGAATTIPLSGDYQHVAGQFNLNGIDATPSGRWLLAVQSVTGRLFRIDPNTGETTLVDLGGTVLTNGDGILLHGRTLYVVQNQLNKIAVLRLSNDLTSGQLLREITDTDFQVPTTIARFGKWLYAVNARFGTPVTPDTAYHVVQVRR